MFESHSDGLEIGAVAPISCSVGASVVLEWRHSSLRWGKFAI